MNAGPLFYLGTHKSHWIRQLDVPLFVSHRTLAQRRKLPRAVGRWALDSGGFTELSMHGRWKTSTAEYVEAVARYAEDVGGLDWAAPQDWMVEPFILAKTGLSLREHQDRTVENYLSLRGTGLPFVPVLQGWTVDDYHACADLYESAGVDLAAEPTVGVGSVCRRQNEHEAGAIFRTLAERGLRLHGFGVKLAGLVRYGKHLASADSLAWSFEARYSPPMDGCPHASCSNCQRFALRWRERLLARVAETQLDLFAA